MSLLLPSVPAALFLSCFPAVFGTVGMMFAFILIFSIPYARARKKIVLTLKNQFLTEEVIEQEFARRHPLMYNMRIYSSVIMIGMMIVIYIISFAIILTIGANIRF